MSSRPGSRSDVSLLLFRPSSRRCFCSGSCTDLLSGRRGVGPLFHWGRPRLSWIRRLSREQSRRLRHHWDAKPGSREERELDALATLVDAFERRAFPIEALSPIEAIKLRCEQLGWSRKELEQVIGSRARVSEILSGRRPLTLPMIRGIHRALSIPAEILISEVHSPRTAPARRSTKFGRTPAVKSSARAASQGVAPDDRARVRSLARR
jgi:HTH-type transcriptional regulator/antitoxin HigA